MEDGKTETTEERAARVADLAMTFLGMSASTRRELALEALAIAERLQTPLATAQQKTSAPAVRPDDAPQAGVPLTMSIVRALERSTPRGSHMTVAALAQAVFGDEASKSKDKVNKALYNLVQSKRVKRLGNGRYAAVQASARA